MYSPSLGHEVSILTFPIPVLQTGALQNVNQTNCPTKAACSTSSGCECPTDLNNNTGVLVNQFAGYQCVYTNGACTWNAVRSQSEIAFVLRH